MDRKEQKSKLSELMAQLEFPADAKETFLDALERIQDDAAAAEEFYDLLKQYDRSVDCDYEQMLRDVEALGKAVGVHAYTSTMLLFLCMADKFHSRYRERGLDESIYWNTMMDIRYKLEESRLVYGIDGFFESIWFQGFYQFTRFGLGRLQFEIIETKQEYEIAGKVLPAGSKAINVHIPRTGTRLDHEEVLQAYAMAAKMFGDAFGEGPVVFTCRSWLMFPWNAEILNPKSNMALFGNDYQNVGFGYHDGYCEMWRLFDCLYTGDATKLPRDSSLRRAYADRIARGEPVGWGRGFFLYQDGKIYNGKQKKS